MQFDGLKILEDKKFKICKSSDYNFIFNKANGFFARWGKTKDDDPNFSPFGPELADIELTTICKGVDGKLCPFCYKSNSPTGENMSFKTFKTIFKNLPNTITQIAFGVDSQSTSNPEVFEIMQYCRTKGVIPNITISDISSGTAKKLVNVYGAVAVSCYENKNICYNIVKSLTDKGLTQTNIHFMIAEETYEQAKEVLNDILTDPRLKKLNAIVFLSLKKKGRGKSFTPLSKNKFKQIVEFSLKNDISIGFDSCSAPKFLESVQSHSDLKNFEKCSEPCESSAFSLYCNVKGQFFPCSFVEGEKGWENGLDLINLNNFLKDIWFHPKTVEFREKLLSTTANNVLKCRECPIFDI